MLALVYHRTEGRYGRRQWLDDDDGWIVNVMARPNAEMDPSKPYRPVGKAGSLPPPKRLTWRELFFLPKRVEAMRKHGWTEEQMEAAYQRWVKSCNKKGVGD